MPDPSIAANAVSAFVNAYIVTGTQAAGSITLKAFGMKPTVNIPIIVMVGDSVS